MRLVGLRIRGAREWIVYAADSAELQADLAEATLGLLSLTRRATLLNGLEDRSARYGLETMCVGGGQGMAMIVERLS